jgi:hypothetical protein
LPPSADRVDRVVDTKKTRPRETAAPPAPARDADRLAALSSDRQLDFRSDLGAVGRRRTMKNLPLSVPT